MQRVAGLGWGLGGQEMSLLHPIPRVHLLGKRQGLQEAQQQLQGCLCAQAKLQAQRDMLANKLAELGSGEPPPALPLQEDQQSVSSTVSPTHGHQNHRAGACWAPAAPHHVPLGDRACFAPGSGAQWGDCAGDHQEPHLGHLRFQVLGEALDTCSHSDPALTSLPVPRHPLPLLSCPAALLPLLSSPTPLPTLQQPLCPAAPSPCTAAGAGARLDSPRLHPAATSCAPHPGGAEATVPAGLVPRGHPALRGAGAAELQRGLPGAGEPGEAGVRAQRAVGRAASALHHPGC